MCGRCCYTMLKGSICSVNMLVMIAGGLMTAAGVSLLVTEYLYLETIWYEFSIVSYFLLAAGLVTLTLSFLACCGSLISSKCLLATFILSLLCLIVGEITLGVLVYFQVNLLIKTCIVQLSYHIRTLFQQRSCLFYFLRSLAPNTYLILVYYFQS